MTSHCDVMTRRCDMFAAACKISIDDFFIPTTQISIEFVWKSLFGSTRRSVSDVGWWKYWRDVTTWRYDVTSLHKWKIRNIFELSNLKNDWNKKRINFLAHLQAEICIVRFCDVMTWRNDVTSWHKWKINNIFEISVLKIQGNKERINFLAHLQAEICIVRFCEIMTWRHDITS